MSLVLPQWDVAPRVKAFATTRVQGNLATHAGEPGEAVKYRRALRRSAGLPSEPLWMEQVHGNEVAVPGGGRPPRADAAYTRAEDTPLVVTVADCLPVLVASRDGEQIGVAHAGWRGLAAGVIGVLLDRFSTSDVAAWLGPAIGPCHYEVDEVVRSAFDDGTGFRAGRDAAHWMLDLYAVARHQLAARGVLRITGGGICTWCDARFFSYRRQGTTAGRFATVIWKSGG